MGERRERQKRETRQRISDVATALFLARGFEAVTLDEVAEAAQVSKMTVFNYFPRKEDLMLDRHDDLTLLLFREAIAGRRPGESAMAALCARVDALREEKHPFVRFDKSTAAFWRFVAATPPLTARLRELNEVAASSLAEALDGPSPNGWARLAAGMIVLAVQIARQEAADAVGRGVAAKRVRETAFAFLDAGLAAASALLAHHDGFAK